MVFNFFILVWIVLDFDVRVDCLVVRIFILFSVVLVGCVGMVCFMICSVVRGVCSVVFLFYFCFCWLWRMVLGVGCGDGGFVCCVIVFIFFCF